MNGMRAAGFQTQGKIFCHPRSKLMRLSRPIVCYSIVFLLHDHERDIIDQAFGAIAGRKNSYFVRYHAFFQDEECSFQLSKMIVVRDFKTFGPLTGVEVGVECCTECMLFSLKQECDNSKSMLFRKGKMTSTNKFITMPKSKESWAFFCEQFTTSPSSYCQQETV